MNIKSRKIIATTVLALSAGILTGLFVLTQAPQEAYAHGGGVPPANPFTCGTDADELRFMSMATGHDAIPHKVVTPATVFVDFKIKTDISGDVTEKIVYSIYSKNLKNPVFIHVHQLNPDCESPGPHLMTLWANGTRVSPDHGTPSLGVHDGLLLRQAIVPIGTAFEHFADLPFAYTLPNLVWDMQHGNLYVNIHTDSDGIRTGETIENRAWGDVFAPGEIRGPIFQTHYGVPVPTTPFPKP